MSTMMTTVAGCKFCDIAAAKKKDEILKEKEKCIVVKDIKPKSKFHFLVISKQHIPKPTDLTIADIPLIEQMESAGREVLRKHLKKCGDADTIEDMLRVGFHYPPMLNVHHLHMHFIYPISEMGLISRKLTFRPGKVFKSTRDVIENLRQSAGIADPLEDKHEGPEKISAHAIGLG
ncbi:unnamed protein product [Caenorhabditis bovis]|uniref:Adenosine 5'-monophosphoramidase HINT3 n=1 Tax=Caenorhabditis bovis TaxID=2654633 RepID=A0A8S1E4Z9_9PELO|nr:unnamed protein product [Caenorhabditis bovis]